MLPFNPLRLRYVIILLIGIGLMSKSQAQSLSGWKTNTDKSIIDLNELKKGGPPKDGIPSIDNPKFVTTREADSWISEQEPIIALEYSGEARAYPLQILIWHEIVNEEIKGDPLLVTFCPLCYSALVFDRTIEGETHEFGVSGFLRHSDLVMFDRKTETLWQQFTGKAIVGDYVGKTLEQIPSQIISFDQFKDAYPDGKVLSRETGHKRDYGSNPYSGYDDIDNTPLFGAGGDDSRLPPMEKVIGVKVNGNQKAYPYSITQEAKVINDNIGDTPVAVFHLDGALSALDESNMSESQEDGSTGVFKRTLNGETLTFEFRSDQIYDLETGSKWDITGKALEGELRGEQLQPVTSGDYFSFAWLVFWPDTKMYDK